jgi:AcrR family transcriptional regulator
LSARKHIDRQQVIDTGIALADAHGFEAVTLASVAEQLGIRIPSLYNHVAGLTGLRHEIQLWGLRQLGEQMRRAAVGKSGEDAILRVAHAYREFAHLHPGVYSATLRAAAPDESDIAAAGQDIIEVVLAILEPYHFSPDDNLHVVRGLRSVLHGFVDLETAGGFGLALDRDESFRQLLQRFIQGLRVPVH